MVLANSLLGTTRVTSAVLALVAATLVACGGSALPGSEGELEGGSEFIVGGSDIDIQTAPWQVSLIGESGSHSCGGTIIAADWVLTAGHCAPVVGGMVGAGASVQSELQSSGQMRSIAEVFVLPGFSSEELLQKGHDLALIKLDSPLELNASTKAIAFAKAGDQALYAKGTAGLISGWGTIEFMGEPADQLKGLNVAVVDPEPGVASDTVAVGEPDGSGCHGDSGGPLVVSPERMATCACAANQRTTRAPVSTRTGSNQRWAAPASGQAQTGNADLKRLRAGWILATACKAGPTRAGTNVCPANGALQPKKAALQGPVAKPSHSTDLLFGAADVEALHHAVEAWARDLRGFGCA
jgi:Trypsin